jgi:signal peptidase I
VTRAFWLGVLVLGVAVVVAIPFGIRARFQGFAVPSASMAPALLPGDYILVDKAVRAADRGDVIVFTDPTDTGDYLVKRVVGLAGEQVTVLGRAVYVDCAPPADGCRPLTEPYALFDGPARTPQRFGPFRVPAGGYFVMADHRNAGEDSRVLGAVGWERIAGRPIVIYWSQDPETRTVRWDRVGRVVR